MVISTKNEINRNYMIVEDSNIIRNSIRTPDGTILTSKHRHDYVSYTDTNGQYYAVDGGLSYLKRNYDKPDYQELSLYDNEPFEVIRENLERLNVGVDGTENPKWFKLCDMDDEWLSNVIIYEEDKRPNNPYLKYYISEQKYRKNNK